MLAQPCPSANVRLPSPRSDALLIFLASHSALLSLSVALPAPVWRTAYLHEITVELKTRRYIEYWIWCCRRENSAATATVPFYWDPTPPPIWMHVICARTDSRTGIATIGRTTAACAAWVSVRGAAFTRRSSRRCGDSAFLPLLLLLLLLRHGQHPHSHALHIRTPTPVFLSYLILSYRMLSLLWVASVLQGTHRASFLSSLVPPTHARQATVVALWHSIILTLASFWPPRITDTHNQVHVFAIGVLAAGCCSYCHPVLCRTHDYSVVRPTERNYTCHGARWCWTTRLETHWCGVIAAGLVDGAQTRRLWRIQSYWHSAFISIAPQIVEVLLWQPLFSKVDLCFREQWPFLHYGR